MTIHRAVSRPTTAIVLAVALAALLLPALAQEGEAVPQAAVPEIPSDAKKLRNPVEANEASLEHGRLLFSSQCTMCHGAQGRGDGTLAGRLKLKMPDFGDSAHQRVRSDGELFYVLTNGHGRMPGEGERLPENSRWDLINFVRTLDD